MIYGQSTYPHLSVNRKRKKRVKFVPRNNRSNLPSSPQKKKVRRIEPHPFIALCFSNHDGQDRVGGVYATKWAQPHGTSELGISEKTIQHMLRFREPGECLRVIYTGVGDGIVYWRWRRDMGGLREMWIDSCRWVDFLCSFVIDCCSVGCFCLV